MDRGCLPGVRPPYLEEAVRAQQGAASGARRAAPQVSAAEAKDLPAATSAARPAPVMTSRRQTSA